MPLIEAKNLGKSYYGDGVETIALRGVTFSIKAGEFVAITGPSGSGKSTLLHLIGILDKNTSGKYLFEGKYIDEYTNDELAHIRNKKMGFIFQAFNLLPRASVLENVKLPLMYSRSPQDSWDSLARDAIRTVGLTHRTDYRPPQLSGGEKQRVAIARALVTHPNVIFADEPTGNLDSKSGKIVMETLQKLNEDHGHTIILITHEKYTAEHASRIINIVDGAIESDRVVNNRRTSLDEFIK